MCATSLEFALAVGRGALGIALLSLCGYGVSRLTGDEAHDSASRLAISLGIGISVVACCWLLSAIHQGLLWAALLLLVALSLGLLVRDLSKRPTKRHVAAFHLALACTLGLRSWRIYQVRDLVFPPWVDSVHHAVIIRKMQETWRLPRDLSPYLQMPFFYHFAFHGVVSLFAEVARLSLPQAMIVMGQALQVGVGLSVYCLARAVWPTRPWAAAASALVCLVAQMPAFYTAWGKYSLLTSMVLLPLAMAMTIAMIRDGASPRRLMALATLVAGTILAHSFVAFLLILFIGIALGNAAGEHLLRRRVHPVACAPELWDTRAPELRSTRAPALRGARAVGHGWRYVVGGTVLGVVMVLPWIRWVWAHAGRFVDVQVGKEALVSTTDQLPGYLAYLWELTGPNRNRLLLALALSGIGLALRRPFLRPIALWLMALLLFANPWGLRLRPFSPDRAVIVLFLPGCLLATEVLRVIAGKLALWDAVAIDWGRARQAMAVVVAAWALWGGLETRNLVPESAILASEADAKAMIWIQAHVSPDARFFIRVAPWPPYGYRGMDGGWWLLPMTGRHTLLPPALYGLSDSAEVERTNEMARGASVIAGCGPRFWELVAQQGLTHVYFDAERAGLRPRSFDDCPSVKRVYAQDGIYIYQLLWPGQD